VSDDASDDAMTDDAATEDGGPPGVLRQGGCQCTAVPASPATARAAVALLALLPFARRRRR